MVVQSSPQLNNGCSIYSKSSLSHGTQTVIHKSI